MTFPLFTLYNLTQRLIDEVDILFTDEPQVTLELNTLVGERMKVTTDTNRLLVYASLHLATKNPQLDFFYHQYYQVIDSAMVNHSKLNIKTSITHQYYKRKCTFFKF